MSIEDRIDRARLGPQEVAGDRRPLRLLMTTPLYVPHVGGVERYVEMLARCLAALGVSVTVLTTDPAGRSLPWEKVAGVDIVRVPAWPRRRDYHLAPKIYDVVRCGAWDIVHVQSYHTFVAPIAMLGAIRAETPYVVTFHGGGHSSWWRRRIRTPQWTLLRPLLTRADRLIAIASFEIELYGAALALPPERFALIPVGVDAPRCCARPDPPVRTDAIIASVGRLERYKGHHRLIEALPHVLRARPNTRVWIGGAGPYAEQLRRTAQRLGVAEHVEIRAVPAEDRRAMEAELSNAALVVLFSDCETSPSALLEAIALRRPVLVTRARGLDDLADRGLARSIPRKSTPEEIADAILDELEDPFIPAQVDLPSWDDCAAEHLELYASVMQSRPNRVGTCG